MVLGRGRVVAGFLFEHSCSSAGHDILKFVVEVFCCHVVSRRVGVGRVEGCGRVVMGRGLRMVSVSRVFVPN